METSKTSEIDELILNLLNISSSFQSLNKVFESKFSLSIVQWAFMKTLLQMPAAAPQILAKVLHVTPGTLTQTIVRLERKKYIFVCGDPKDARKKMISLTREGKENLDSVDRGFERIFSPYKTKKKEINAVEGFLDTTLSEISH